MSQQTPKSPAPEPNAKRAAAKRGRRRILIIACSTFFLLWIVVAQSGLLARFVVPMLRATLPCDVSCGRVTMDALGRITIRDVSLTIPSIDGPASEFLAASTVTATLDWSSVFSGAPRIASIKLRSPVVRLSVAPDQSLNVAALRTSGGGVPGKIPELVLTRARLELGEHDPDSGAYDDLFTLRVDGAMKAQPADPRLYSITLAELLTKEEQLLRSPTSIDGWINITTVEGAITVHAVDLASWSERAAPLSVRDLWEQMAMRGSINDARFTFSSKKLLEASFALENVDLRIPLQRVARTEDQDPSADDLVSMTGVSGSLRFDPRGFEGDLRGQIEDLACHVSLRTDGLALNAPLECNIRAEDFTVAEHPQLMPFAPAFVGDIFRQFSGPTAEVSGVIRVERGAPTTNQAAPLAVSGAFTFEHGQAKYEYFPYPFHNMRGTINFDADTIDIVSISARGPSGSSLLASGTIAPPREGAAVDLVISVADVPIDEAFYAAMPPDRSQVLDAIFDKPAYQHLLDTGLLITSAHRAEIEQHLRDTTMQLRMLERDNPGDSQNAALLNAQIDTANLQLQTPVFDLGGYASLAILVTRAFGPDAHYQTSIGIRLDNAGIIANAFPYPVNADEVRVQIDEATAHISAPSLTAPSGASGSLIGTVLFGFDSGDYQPSLDIRAHNIPVDPLLTAAIPAAEKDSNDSFNPRDLVSRLGISGAIDCTAAIRPHANPDRDLTYEIKIDLDRLKAQPTNSPLALTDLTGKIRITPTQFALSAASASLDAAALSFDLHSTFSPDPTIQGSITAHALDLASPFEQIAATISPGLQPVLASLRDKHQPAGMVDAFVSIDGPADAPEYTVRLSNFTTASFTTDMGRATLSQSSGEIEITELAISFDDFSAQLELDAAPTGHISLQGDWRTSQTSRDGSLRAQLAGAALDAPLIRSFTDSAGAAAHEWITRHNPRGTIDLQADIISNNNEIKSTASKVSPRALTLDFEDRTLEFHSGSGWLTLADSGAQFEQLHLEADHWSTTINGSLNLEPTPVADLSLALKARGLPQSLVSILPADVADALNAIQLDVQGVLSMDNASLQISGDPAARNTRFQGDLAFSGASIDTGVAIDQLAGTAHLDIAAGPAPEDSTFNATIAADTLRVFAVEMTNAMALVTRDTQLGAFTVRNARAAAHKGLVSAEATIVPTTTDRPARYKVDVKAIDIDLASLLDQLKPVNPEEDPQSAEQTAKRGMLDLSISVEGNPGDPDSRRGRGLARVQGGDALGVPGAMPLIRLSNLQLPFGEPLSFAYADFHIAADTLQVTDMQLLSKSIAVVGSGDLALEDLALDLRFHSRGRNRVPIVSDLLEGVRDEFITAIVRGTLKDPEFTYEQFAGTRKMLDAIFSSRPSEPRTVRAKDDE